MGVERFTKIRHAPKIFSKYYVIVIYKSIKINICIFSVAVNNLSTVKTIRNW